MSESILLPEEAEMIDNIRKAVKLRREGMSGRKGHIADSVSEGLFGVLSAAQGSPTSANDFRVVLRHLDLVSRA